VPQGQISLIVLFVLGAVAGYAYRFELQGVARHVLGVLIPSRGEQVGAGSISFEAWPDGEFRVDALVTRGRPYGLLVRCQTTYHPLVMGGSPSGKSGVHQAAFAKGRIKQGAES
jgi:hypothetical protein